MNKIKIKTLTKARKCAFSGFMSQFNVRGEETKYLHLLSLNKQAIREMLQWKSYEDRDVMNEFRSFFDENVNESYFFSTQSYEIEKKIFVTNLYRLYAHIQATGTSVIDLNGQGVSMVYQDNKITSSYDIALEYGDRIDVIKIKNSAPKLSYSNRAKEDNRPYNDLELYTMKKGAEKKFKYYNKPIHAAYYHLKGKHDKDKDYGIYYNMLCDGNYSEVDLEISTCENEIEYYTSVEPKKSEVNKRKTKLKKLKGIAWFNGDTELEKGIHIIECNEFNEDGILAEIDRLLDLELNVGSEKCEGSHCDICPNKVICMVNKNATVELEEIIEEVVESDVKEKFPPTKEQNDVINHKERVVTIVAAPGTGKTKTTVDRFVKVINEELNPKDIVQFTYTTQGAIEFKERVSKLLNNVSYNEVNSFTFNAWGGMIVSMEYEKLGFTSAPIVLNQIEKTDVIIELIQDDKYKKMEWLRWQHPLMKTKNALGAVHELIKAFDSRKKDGCFKDYYTWQAEMLEDAYSDYNNKIWSMNRIDYADQLLLTLKLFEEFPELIEKYGYVDITCDESNDLNDMQVRVVQELMKHTKFKSLTICGDPRQNLFKFSNSSAKYMLNADEYFGETKKLDMSLNFRSTTQICDLANKVNLLNQDNSDKLMTSFKGHGEPNELIGYDTKSEEYQGIANIIKSNDRPVTDYLILAYTRNELMDIKSVLMKNNIPCHVMVTEPFVKNHNVLMAINLAKYINNFVNRQYLLEYLMYTSKESIIRHEMEERIDEYEKTLLEEFLLPKLEDDEEDSYDKFGMYNDLLNPLLEDEICSEFFDKIFEDTYHTFSQLNTKLSKYVNYNETSAPTMSKEKKFNAVSLCTAHGIKGGESPCVITSLSGFKWDKNNVEAQDDVRRVEFVALSRAKEKNYITHNFNMDKSRNKGVINEYAKEIKEILDENV